MNRNNLTKISALILLLSVPLFAVEPIGPISFELGVDYSRLCSEIDDKRACDSANMYGDRVGSAGVRNGSHRINETAVSTNPFSALYSATISTTNLQVNVNIGVSGDTIYYSTDSTFSRWSILYRGLTTHNQKFSFAQAQNNIYMTGDALTDPIFKWDVVNSSFGVAISSVGINQAVIYAKYLLWEGNYMLAGNVRDVKDLYLNSNTTYYDDRIYYTHLLAPTSFTIDRIINVQLGDGESLTGMTSKRSSEVGTRIVMAYKQSSAHAISFTVLNPAGEGGNQQITRVADGFGHVGETSPENIGAWDILLSRDGILQWNGGLLTRSNLEAEKVVISGQIKTLIDKLILRGTYKKSLIKHYPKSNYLVFAYEDPDRFPQGRLNSMQFYDLLTGEWWPMRNPITGSLETDKGPNGTGKLMYGDGMDGYVHILDDPVDSDDSRKEISLDAMETTQGWLNASISSTVVAVGTASLRLDLTGATRTSSMTKVFVMPLGEWYDKSQSSSTDKISFKIFVSSVGYLSRLRIDLQVKDVQNHFDGNFSSVTISSSALTAGSSTWQSVEIALSSFPIRPDWIDFQTESVPFARNLTRFGIRFVATGTEGLSLYFDDIRTVQATRNPLNPFRLTKQFNFGTLSDKEWAQVVLSREKQRDGSFNIDVLTGQGYLANTITIDRDVPQEFFVCNFSSITGISRLNSVDFSMTIGTATSSSNAFAFETGAADGSFVYSYDKTNDKLVRINRSSMTVFVSTYGALGAGTTNFNYVQEIAVETPSDGNILVVDHMNHRLKEHKKKGFAFVRQYGQLGMAATSFYNPTGADWDSKNIFVLDDGNQSIKKFTRNYVLEREAKLDINTIGNGSIRVGPEFLFVAYNRGSNDAIYFIDVVLEKRRKSDLSLVSRVTVRPENVVVNSTYSTRGSIGLHSKFVYLTFNDNSTTAGTFYLQKRLQSDLSLVDEISSQNSMNGVIGDGLAREPSQITQKIDLKASLPDPYLQLRFYAKDDLESSFKLTEMSILAIKNPYSPTPN